MASTAMEKYREATKAGCFPINAVDICNRFVQLCHFFQREDKTKQGQQFLVDRVVDGIGDGWTIGPCVVAMCSGPVWSLCCHVMLWSLRYCIVLCSGPVWSLCCQGFVLLHCALSGPQLHRCSGNGIIVPWLH